MHYIKIPFDFIDTKWLLNHDLTKFMPYVYAYIQSHQLSYYENHFIFSVQHLLQEIGFETQYSCNLNSPLDQLNKCLNFLIKTQIISLDSYSKTICLKDVIVGKILSSNILKNNVDISIADWNKINCIQYNKIKKYPIWHMYCYIIYWKTNLNNEYKRIKEITDFCDLSYLTIKKYSKILSQNNMFQIKHSLSNRNFINCC